MDDRRKRACTPRESLNWERELRGINRLTILIVLAPVKSALIYEMISTTLIAHLNAEWCDSSRANVCDVVVPSFLHAAKNV